MPQSSAKPFSGIFISYRRDENSIHARTLADKLCEHFGEGSVFMDIDHIPPGADFVQVIEQAVGSCEVLIAIIGRNWLSAVDQKGNRLLDKPTNFIRIEITAALQREIRVIPILVQGVTMPSPEELPEALSKLSRLNAFQLSDLRWTRDVTDLVRALEKILAERQALLEEQKKEVPGPVLAADVQHEGGQEQANAYLAQADKERLRIETEEEELIKREADETRRKVEKEKAEQASFEAEKTKRTQETGAIRRSLRNRIVVGSGLVSLLMILVVIGIILVNGLKPVPPGPTPGSSPDAKALPEVPSGMVRVYGGEKFMMGRDDGDENSVNERPAHLVPVADFFIDQHEVTCGEYKNFSSSRHRPPSGCGNGAFTADSENKPVTGMNWKDAEAYCLDQTKRLPKEEQWEFAARGPNGYLYPWGNDWHVGLANIGNQNGGLKEFDLSTGSASPFGALDMLGNAWEWTASDLTPYPNGVLSQQLTQGMSESHGASWKVIRGGSFRSKIDRTTTTTRQGIRADQGSRALDAGFRCAMTLPGGPNQ